MKAGAVRILAVEDSISDVWLLQEALEKSGLTYEMTRLEDGAQALSYLRQEPPYTAALAPDLVILDLNLPKVDGRAVLELFKFDAKLRGIPVVVWSSSRSPRDMARALEVPKGIYIEKPHDLDGLQSLGPRIAAFWHGQPPPAP